LCETLPDSNNVLLYVALSVDELLMYKSLIDTWVTEKLMFGDQSLTNMQHSSVAWLILLTKIILNLLMLWKKLCFSFWHTSKVGTAPDFMIFFNEMFVSGYSNPGYSNPGMSPTWHMVAPDYTMTGP
jgi:hypothetical protein